MKLLFICTHNRCRSIIAEAVCNSLGADVLEARSAGSQPSGEVHPLSLRYLQEAGISIDGLRSQSWDDYEDWRPDMVITVCDQAAGEQCPIWFNRSPRVHWGLKDPSRIEGTEEEVAAAFRHTIERLHGRLEQVLAAGPANLDSEQLLALFKRLGES